MNGKKARILRAEAKKMYEGLSESAKKKTTEKRMYKWLKKQSENRT